jgi:pimeloyl-ACP methyl ester carboxylesterase
VERINENISLRVLQTRVEASMPFLYLNGAKIHYDENGTGQEAIVFAHGLLWSGRVFERQVSFFKERYRCITFDFRGQGKSQVTDIGYDVDTLTEDTAALIRALGCAPCHFVGLSMGGFVGMRLACRYPSLIKSLMLLETSADPESRENIRKFRLLAFIARWLGVKIVVAQVMPVLFGKKFLKEPTREKLRQEMKLQLVRNHRIGVARAVKGVIARTSFYEDLHKIQTPTLIVVGDQDIATPTGQAERIHAQIAGSRLVIIPGAGHTSPVEEPEAVNQVILEFIN